MKKSMNGASSDMFTSFLVAYCAEFVLAAWRALWVWSGWKILSKYFDLPLVGYGDWYIGAMVLGAFGAWVASIIHRKK